ncbi:MAG: type II toxin-antitoxin system RelB/DinJ family antitoxin [Patescibacteria group bacterium]
MTTLNVRIDESLKKEAQKTFAGLGMDMSTAIKVFFQQAVHDQALPFLPSRKPTSRAEQKALAVRLKKEVEETLREGKVYTDVEEFIKDLGV